MAQTEYRTADGGRSYLIGRYPPRQWFVSESVRRKGGGMEIVGERHFPSRDKAMLYVRLRIDMIEGGG